MTTVTATTTTAPKTQAARACWWLTAPFALPDGRLMGHLAMRVGTVKDFYRVVRTEADDMAEHWSVSKELPNGDYAEPYFIRLPAGGGRTAPVCTCPAWRWNANKCRHTAALTAILARTAG